MNTERTKSKRTDVRDPVQTRGIKTKEKIIQAGKDLIAARGYHNVTADEIAHAAGVSVGSFYAYFSDKRSLFLAIVDDYLTRGGAVVLEGAGAFPSIEKVDAPSLIMKTVSLLLSVHRASGPPLLNEIVKMALADEEVKRRFDELDGHVMALVGDTLIQSGFEKTRAPAAAFMIFRASEGIIHALVLDRRDIDEEAVLTEMTRLFTSYLRDAV